MELITGKKFEALHGFNVIYRKIDHVNRFYAAERPTYPYILVTHNGDEPIDSRYMPLLNDSNLIKWYGTNVCISHPKLQSIPIGIPNPQWIREEIYKEVPDTERTNLIYFNSFAKGNNMKERTVCEAMLNNFGYQMPERIGVVELMQEYKKAFFVPAPNGNGIDTHRLWECLYMGAIPIVTRSINTDYYRDMPIYFLDKWEDFDPSVITVELYHKLWSENALGAVNKLDFNYWKKLIQGS